MQWQPQADQNSRIARATMLRTIREFFYQRNVLEVETPALSQAANTDPFIDSFEVVISRLKRYLHTSPEYAMKRLLAAGSGDIYQICKVWRNEPLSTHHNAEFSMLEYYRVGFDLADLMNEVEQLFREILPDLKSDSKYQTYESLFLDNLGFNPHTIASEALQRCVVERVPSFQGELDRQASLDLLLTHCIEPDFDNDRITFVYDYPASQSALAKTEAISDGSSTQIAKRFEVYIGSLELANGYQELTDASANQAVLEKELEARKALGITAVPDDRRFLAAMEAGMPECSGVAIGLDRLLMRATGASTLAEVLNFSWENA